MQETISVETNPSFWDSYRVSLLMILYAPYYWIFVAVFPLAGCYLIYLWITHCHTPDIYEVLMVLGAFFFTPITSAIRVFIARRGKFARGPFKFVFDASGMHISGTGFTVFIEWSSMHKVVESKRNVFFMISRGRAYVVPVRAFEQTGQLEPLRTLVGQHINRAKMRGT